MIRNLFLSLSLIACSVMYSVEHSVNQHMQEMKQELNQQMAQLSQPVVMKDDINYWDTIVVKTLSSSNLANSTLKCNSWL